MLSSKRTSGRIPWALLSIEAVLVVLSVLLALGLNSWREGRAEQDLARRALQTVLDEAEENCLMVQNLLPYHRSVYVGDEEYEGLGIAFLRNDAWTSAQTAGAAHHMDYGVASAVGSVHALQVDHRRLVEAGIQGVYAAGASLDPYGERFPPEEQERDDWLRGPHPNMLADLIRIESELLKGYHALFAVSEEHYGIEADTSCAHPEGRDGAPTEN